MAGSLVCPLPRSGGCGGRISPVFPDEPPHVVGKIGKADLHPRPGDPDRAHNQDHRPFLISEDVLDSRADFGFAGIGNAG